MVSVIRYHSIDIYGVEPMQISSGNKMIEKCDSTLDKKSFHTFDDKRLIFTIFIRVMRFKS